MTATFSNIIHWPSLNRTFHMFFLSNFLVFPVTMHYGNVKFPGISSGLLMIQSFIDWQILSHVIGKKYRPVLFTFYWNIDQGPEQHMCSFRPHYGKHVLFTLPENHPSTYPFWIDRRIWIHVLLMKGQTHGSTLFAFNFGFYDDWRNNENKTVKYREITLEQ